MSLFAEPSDEPPPPVELRLSWDEVRRDCYHLCNKLANVPVTCVLAVARGGLVPAAIVAQRLGVTDVRLCAFRSYGGGRAAGRLVCTVPPDPALLAGDGVLVVDDLVDTGATMTAIGEMLPGAVRVAPYAKPRGAPVLHLYARPVPQATWIIFPWEA